MKLLKARLLHLVVHATPLLERPWSLHRCVLLVEEGTGSPRTYVGKEWLTYHQLWRPNTVSIGRGHTKC
jgi:hypothetical protein